MAIIEGKITHYGVESEFRIDTDGEMLYSQWGANLPHLGKLVEVLHDTAMAAREHLRDVCTTCGEALTEDQEGLCESCEEQEQGAGPEE